MATKRTKAALDTPPLVAAPGNAGAPAITPAAPRKVKRTRSRASVMKAERTAIAERVIKFFKDDNVNRSADLERRVQLYAKFRMWTEGQDFPWPGASDVGLSDITAAVLKLEDTMVNAVNQTRPCIVSKAYKKVDSEKQKKVDDLLDYQFFEEASGEEKIGKMARNFVVDGVVRIFTPWIKEKNSVHTIRQLEPIPEGTPPGHYFAQQMMTAYPAPYQIAENDPDGWRWTVRKEREVFTVDFYTGKDGMVEMDAERIATVFDGPCPLVKDYEEICYPAGAENLQRPGPSNPRGAAHVVMHDYPTLDEIKRLIESGYYDQPSDEDLKKLGMAIEDRHEGQIMREQKDVMAGVVRREDEAITQERKPGEPSEAMVNDHKPLTRLTCFDIYDYDGDGKAEDVIWWVILETKTLLRVRELTQQFPSNPPRRPFAEAQFLPENVSLPELMEGLHDVSKVVLDMTINKGALELSPWGLYRQTSSIRNETIRYKLGELYGVSDPKNDVHFPQMPNSGSSYGFNMLSTLTAFEERLVTTGDLQYGRVPQGKASALRTVRGMQSILGQGEGRPERVIRRFFSCLSEIYAQMHELNQAFLPKGKQFRVFGVARPGDDPYRTLQDPAAEIYGRFTFGFSANAMNTSKQALQEALGQLGQTLMNPLMLQMGIVQPDGAYNWGRDYTKALGQDPDRYLSPPSPESNLPKYTAEDVINSIMSGVLPECQPLEDAQTHMDRLMEFATTQTVQVKHPATGTMVEAPAIHLLTPQQIDLLKAYLNLTVQRVAEQRRKAQLVAAAGSQAGTGAPPGIPGPAPGQQPNPQAANQQAMLGKNELANEALPGAGGGGNPGPRMMQ